MKICDILKARRTLSFEFYPPKSEEGLPSVFRAIERLAAYRPDFISITYGAGGSTRERTVGIAIRVHRKTDLTVMCHLTCAGQTKEEVHGVLVRLQEAGIENVIALRGDPPRGQERFVPVEGGFAHATDLMEHIRRHFDFCVAGACYPEGHPESPDLWTDMRYTKLKVEAGARFLITQLFYDNADFYAFMDRAAQVGLSVPVIPGVLPILSTRQVRRFTAMCGARIPPELDAQLERYIDDDRAARELGVEYATRQVQELWEWGVPGVHFYVLNRTYSVSRVLENLGLHTPQARQAGISAGGSP